MNVKKVSLPSCKLCQSCGAQMVNQGWEIERDVDGDGNIDVSLFVCDDCYNTKYKDAAPASAPQARRQASAPPPSRRAPRLSRRAKRVCVWSMVAVAAIAAVILVIVLPIAFAPRAEEYEVGAIWERVGYRNTFDADNIDEEFGDGDIVLDAASIMRNTVCIDLSGYFGDCETFDFNRAVIIGEDVTSVAFIGGNVDGKEKIIRNLSIQAPEREKPLELVFEDFSWSSRLGFYFTQKTQLIIATEGRCAFRGELGSARGVDMLRARDLELYVYGELTIEGGDGADGSAASTDGYGGGRGIVAEKLKIGGDGFLSVKGGNGGCGHFGAAGMDGSAGKIGSDAWAGIGYGEGKRGGDGERGADGAKGGDGGAGAAGIYTTSGKRASFLKNVRCEISSGFSGSGGSGGCGGRGGDGGRGGACTDSWLHGHICGGDGGNGGRGGDGGEGGAVRAAEPPTNFTLPKNENISVVARDGMPVCGMGGNGGYGGYGGSAEGCSYGCVSAGDRGPDGAVGARGTTVD